MILKFFLRFSGSHARKPLTPPGNVSVGSSFLSLCLASRVTLIESIFVMRGKGRKENATLRELAKLAGLNPDETRPREEDRGLTLAEFATAKRLPVDFLEGCGGGRPRAKTDDLT